MKQLIKTEHVSIYNWLNALRGMRNSFASWDKADSTVDPKTGSFTMGPSDYDLALRLAKAGSSHRKYMRQVLVSVDITAGAEWWKEFDTYKIGTVANSTSMMHTLGRRLLEPTDFSFDDPDDPLVGVLLVAVNAIIKQWWAAGRKVGTPEWRRMQKAIPIGFLYTRTVTLNYEVLRTIFHDRKGHRLAEWKAFCDWIRSLPYSELITLEGVTRETGNHP